MTVTAIKKIHQDRGLKQKFVAEISGISEQIYSNIACGRFIPSRRQAERIARALDEKVERLFPKIWGE